MRPSSFNYHRPTSLTEAVTLLEEEGSSEVLAGGQSLVPEMNRRTANPETLIDISKLEGLSYIREVDGSIAIGALSTHFEIANSGLIEERLPILENAASNIGDPIVRKQGTIGGNLADADPRADYLPVVVALDATIEVTGASGDRRVSAAEFFRGSQETTLNGSEIITEIRIPEPSDEARGSYTRVTRRKNDPPLASVATVFSLTPDGECEDVRIVVGAVDTKPVRAREAEDLLEGAELDASTLSQVAERAAEAPTNPYHSVHASSSYRMNVVESLAERALQRAMNGR